MLLVDLRDLRRFSRFVASSWLGRWLVFGVSNGSSSGYEGVQALNTLIQQNGGVQCRCEHHLVSISRRNQANKSRILNRIPATGHLKIPSALASAIHQSTGEQSLITKQNSAIHSTGINEAHRIQSKRSSRNQREFTVTSLSSSIVSHILIVNLRAHSSIQCRYSRSPLAFIATQRSHSSNRISLWPNRTHPT